MLDIMKRLTITMPEDVYERLLARVPSGQISSYITSAVESKLAVFPRPIKDVRQAIRDFRASLTEENSMTVDEILDLRDRDRA